MPMRWVYQLLGVFDVADWEYCTSETHFEFNQFNANQFVPELSSIILRTTNILPAVGIFFVSSILV